MLEQLVPQIKARLATGQYQSESAIREAVVLPILQALGWDTLDPKAVHREYTLGTTKVDYALSAPPTKKQIFIEVKALGSTLGGDKQLFGYAFHEGIPFAILTDGREWNFYLPGEQGTYDERRVQKLDIVDRHIGEVITKMLAPARL
jgi:predicted type IV restriction endonuclease